jgi:neutral trehalase
MSIQGRKREMLSSRWNLRVRSKRVFWDSYFALLGLVLQGKWQLAREIVKGFVAEIEELGIIPNYNGF